MHSMTLEEILAEASRLSPEKRLQLVRALIGDLGRPAYDVSNEEVAERIRETRDGLVDDLSHEELVEGLRYLTAK